MIVFPFHLDENDPVFPADTITPTSDDPSTAGTAIRRETVALCGASYLLPNAKRGFIATPRRPSK